MLHINLLTLTTFIFKGLFISLGNIFYNQFYFLRPIIIHAVQFFPFQLINMCLFNNAKDYLLNSLPGI